MGKVSLDAEGSETSVVLSDSRCGYCQLGIKWQYNKFCWLASESHIFLCVMIYEKICEVALADKRNQDTGGGFTCVNYSGSVDGDVDMLPITISKISPLLPRRQCVVEHTREWYRPRPHCRRQRRRQTKVLVS